MFDLPLTSNNINHSLGRIFYPCSFHFKCSRLCTDKLILTGLKILDKHVLQIDRSKYIWAALQKGSLYVWVTSSVSNNVGWNVFCRTRKVSLPTSRGWFLPVSNWKMAAHLLIITYKRNQPFTWSWGSGEEPWLKWRLWLEKKLKSTLSQLIRLTGSRKE